MVDEKVTALVAVRIEILSFTGPPAPRKVTALVAVRIEIARRFISAAAALGHRPCGGED